MCSPRKCRCVSGALLLVWCLGSAGLSAAEEEALRDPFVFGAEEVVAAPALPVEPLKPKGPRLIGVLWDAKNPVAVIDGEPFGIGQDVKGWRIITIRPEQVTIQRGDQQVTLTTGDMIPTE